MSTKKKQAVIWFRFKFADTAAGRMQIQRAADKLFRLPCISERRTYTEEEVVGMVKEALEKAEAERHICRNCRNGTNYGEDGVYCNLKQEWRDEFLDDFGENCKTFERWPKEKG